MTVGDVSDGRTDVWVGALATKSTSGGSPWPQSASRAAAAVLARMTPEEKFGLLFGQAGPYDGNVPAVPRVGIPALRLQVRSSL